MASDIGLRLDFLSGTYFCRAGGLFLENSATWVRLNLGFGALFPSYAGELYWVMRLVTSPSARTD